MDGVMNLYQLNQTRLIHLWPLLSLKWSTIVLSRASREIIRDDAVSAGESIELAKLYVFEASRPPCSLADIVERSKKLTMGRKKA